MNERFLPNFTQTPNIVTDEMMCSISGSEFKFLMCVVRKTYGFHKESDSISTSQIMKMTGFGSNNTAIKAGDSLVEKGIIIAVKKDRTTTEWALNLDFLPKLKKTSKKKESEETEQSTNEVPLVIKAFEEIDLKNKEYYGNKTQRAACQFLIENYGLEKVIGVIEQILPQTNQRPRYEFPHISTPKMLKENWSKVKDGIAFKQGEVKVNKVAFY